MSWSQYQSKSSFSCCNFSFWDLSYFGRGRGGGHDDNRKADLKRITLITEWIYSNEHDTQYYGLSPPPTKTRKQLSPENRELHVACRGIQHSCNLPIAFAMQGGISKQQIQTLCHYFDKGCCLTNRETILKWQQCVIKQPTVLNTTIGLKRTIPLEDEWVFLGFKGHQK